MTLALFIISNTVDFFIMALTVILILRVILQMFVSEESKALQFCYAITEPMVSPVRKALFKIPFFEESGMDFSFIVTAFLLMIVNFVLMIVTAGVF